MMDLAQVRRESARLSAAMADLRASQERSDLLDAEVRRHDDVVARAIAAAERLLTVSDLDLRTGRDPAVLQASEEAFRKADALRREALTLQTGSASARVRGTARSRFDAGVTDPR